MIDSAGENSSSFFFQPYHGESFFGFLLLFFGRMWALLTGNLSIDSLVSDEIQVLVLVGVAISSALVGAFLVLRQMTMLANSLSHTILLGIVLAYFMASILWQEGDGGYSHTPAMQWMIIAALLMGFVTVYGTEFLTKVGKLQEDASIGLIFTALFALGVVSATILTRNAHIGIEAVMGNADALHKNDLYWVYIVAALNIFLFFLFYKEYKITTFDPSLALALGISPQFFNYLLMGQVATTTITSFHAVGVLLVLSFMTGPVLVARIITHRFTLFLIASVCMGVFSALIGVALTRHILTEYGAALSTSGVVVCVILLFYLIAITIDFLRKDTC